MTIVTSQVPDLLTGTERCLIGEVPRGSSRWRQTHLNRDIVRRFFNVDPEAGKAITLQRISASGVVVEQVSRKFVYSASNKNWKLELSFGSASEYPSPPNRPLVVIVEAGDHTFRYRTLMPEEAGYAEVKGLLAAGPSIGKGVHRRIVTLDELESYWPESALRGGV